MKLVVGDRVLVLWVSNGSPRYVGTIREITQCGRYVRVVSFWNDNWEKADEVSIIAERKPAVWKWILGLPT
jgi:hypothetical protein